MNNYYVYCYLDPRKPGDFNYAEFHFDYEPIYIGKGRNKRIVEHLHNAQLKRDKNKKKVNKILKIRESGLEPIYYKLYENLLETESLEKEVYLIKSIGRSDLNEGPLTNLTNGGELKCCIFKDLNEETQSKLRKQRSDKMKKENPMKNSETAKKVSEFRKNMTHTDEYKLNMSLSLKKSDKHKKATQSEEFKEKLRLSQIKNMIPVYVYDLNMIFIASYPSIKEASRSLNINKRRISLVMNGKSKTANKLIFRKCPN